MIIGIDVGNSSLKVALLSGDEVVAKAWLPTADSTEADVAACIGDLLDGRGGGTGDRDPDHPSTLACVSVVGGWTARLERVAQGMAVRFLVADERTIPLALDIAHPALTGADRLLAAWAAMLLHGKPVLVADLGTATTVDAVDRDGIYRGGAILPGMQLSLLAMASGADRLPTVDLAAPAGAIGPDTASAMRNGVVLGQLGAIRELATRMRRELGEDDAKLVACGALVSEPWAAGLLTMSGGPGLPALADHVDADLVSRGLGLLAKHAARSEWDATTQGLAGSSVGHP